VSISGGQGSIFGVLMGVIIMGLLSNGMVIIGVSEYYQPTINPKVEPYPNHSLQNL
jgi:ribose/xylose/arabinose/galactoside ABC-type transport system permease subunit